MFRVPDITAEEYADLLDHLDVAVAMTDLDGRIVWVNREFLVLFGYTRAQARDLNVRALIGPESIRTVVHGWKAMRSGEVRSLSGAGALVRQDGTHLRAKIHSVTRRRSADTLVIMFIEDWSDDYWANTDFLPLTEPPSDDAK